MVGCSAQKPMERHEAEFMFFFDTVTNIVAYTTSDEQFEKLSQFVYDELEAYHQLFDIYNDYDGINNIKTINDNAGIKSVEVDQKIIDMLVFAKEQYTKTNGKVNVALGPVLNIWHNYRTEGIDDPFNAQLPTKDELMEANKYTDISQVIIDENNRTVFLTNENMRLDVGAIAKGYAVQKVGEQLEKDGFNSVLMSVGGNVKAIGKKHVNGLENWSVGIQNPDMNSAEQLIQLLSLSDNCLVTSGDYQRFYIVGDKVYHHIIDPETLYPSEYFTSVSIVYPNSGMSDAMSTALFNMSYEEGLEVLKNYEGSYAIWVYKDGTIVYSEGAQKLLKK